MTKLVSYQEGLRCDKLLSDAIMFFFSVFVVSITVINLHSRFRFVALVGVRIESLG